MDNCIFCKIISGEIPSSKVYEDDKVLASLDISQATKGHTLVIPKEHVRNILEMSAETAETVFSRVPKIARAVQKATGAIGMNILNNNEEVAGQTVFHAHIHLVPRYGADDGIHMGFDEHEPDFAALADLADSIAKEAAGNVRASNFVMMGAGSPFIEIPFEYLEKGIMAIFERKGADVVEMNLKALRAGREFAQNYIK